jgi:hypothetical protein
VETSQTRGNQLRRFLDYGQINSLAENAIRPVAIGRRNWLHVGSERAGPRVAPILSVVETCRPHLQRILSFCGNSPRGILSLAYDFFPFVNRPQVAGTMQVKGVPKFVSPMVAQSCQKGV